MDHDLITKLTGQVIAQMRQRTIPLGISNRHVHLSAKDYQSLFPGQTLKIKKPLGQPGQFAAEQTVSLIGPRGQLKNVRILGPLRGQTQVEISYTDARQIGLTAPLRLSGDLTGSASVTLKSEIGEINLTEGVIIARRHIHMSPLDAAIFGVTQGETVKVGIEGTDRKLIFDDVCIRVAEDMRLEMHIDTDEANAAGIDGGQAVARLLLTKR
ncbi:TPA: phosphate propanoyltransferase [Klebsiella quasipneumoniae]|jgi:phosphate propanoyltransferase|uniref:Phosphate propanoyltransferase n=1 Tax=Citrobacter amalonaticus TaxID=35703 RepID=A0A8I0T1J1_CITAM|nr:MULTISPECIES: phosphate propanoyltransferase [Enterobacteriaceae]EDS4325148.1 phosphate propanoyltransferase [Salmonella enterica subsp. enterica serovar Alachua]HBQ8794222.1 phosphate propanoyltransferase [Klebsiella quasipneumoniae]HBW1670299.1 phosphate propanoyltransferase [Klebsiella quasipneumoniae subsp. similipneumoniae]HCZ4740927.1 phosphate propanoyltransferase [Salmonella enterica subsp. enterica serovar Senftenberg str. CFSAN004019]ARD63892.1 propanediol utilization protein [Kos